MKTYILTLDRAIAGPLIDGLCADPNACGKGYLIRRCSVRDNRARGFLLKADDGVVEDNMIDGSTIAGIVLAPELYWSEADYSHGVVIRRNIVRHVAYATNGPGSLQASGIAVVGEGSTLGHDGIQILDNTIEDVAGCNMQIENAANVAVRGNRFVRAHAERSIAGAERGVDTTALIWLRNDSGVVLDHNTADGLGAFGTTAISVGSNTTNLTGVVRGITRDGSR